MARVKRVRSEQTPEGIIHIEEFVDTKTGQVFPSFESVKTKEEFAEARKLPEEERREKLIGFARERERLGPTPSEKVETQQEILEREKLKREGVELPPTEQEPVTAAAMVQEQERRTLDIVGDFVFGNIFEKDPITGEPRIDPKTGEPVRVTLGEVPIGGPLQAKAAFNAAKVATSARAIKLWGGMLKVLRNKVFQKTAKYGALSYVYLTERKVGNIDSALSQVRESITIPVSMAAANPTKIGDSFDMITDLENDVNEYEEALQSKLIESSFNIGLTGRLLPVKQRIKKLRAAIDLSRDQIAKIEATGVVLSDEETALLMDDMNKILDGMVEPIKFLGIF